jgi:hypothetical protein
MQEEHAVTASLYKVKRIIRGRMQYVANESLATHNHVITAVGVITHCASR